MNRVLPTTLFLVAWIGTGIGWLWSSSIWEKSWVERAETFYPPEWRSGEEMARINRQAPLYRENDTYYWVHLTKEARQPDRSWGQTSLDGPTGERPVHWSPVLPGLISLTGGVQAAMTSGTLSDGIHWAGHWLNPWIAWIGSGLLGLVILRGANPWCSAVAILLLFFHPTLQWVFSPSRLDHHGLQALLIGLQTISVCLILSPRTHRSTPTWALLWGVATALGMSISATPQLVISGIITLILAFLLLLPSTPPHSYTSRRRAFLFYGISAGGFSLLLWILIGTLPMASRDITVLHPIHSITILGSGLFLAGLCPPEKSAKFDWKLVAPGLLCGLAPLVWLIPNPSHGHVWLQPFVERMHEFISDYRSPLLENGWSEPGLWLTVALLFLAVFGWGKKTCRFPILLGFALLLLGLWQQRWLSEAAMVAVIGFAFSRFRGSYFVAGLAILASAGLWTHHWTTLEEKPGVQFSADLLLRTLGRDIALNLDRIADGESARVAMVYDFAPQALAFEKVHPIGSLYWENQEGIQKLAQLFAETNEDAAYRMAKELGVDFIVVQPFGTRFALMNQSMNFSAVEDLSSTLAMRLSQNNRVPKGFEPVPFSGTFDPRRVDARIYRVVR